MRNTRILSCLIGSGLCIALLAAMPAHASAQTAELRCRNAIEAALSSWTIATLKARTGCQSDILSAYESPAADCVTGIGTVNLRPRLLAARAKLRSRLLSSCLDVNWGLLSFPGPCPNAPAVFHADALVQCIEGAGTQITDALFDIWYPTEIEPARGPVADCINSVAKRASTMVVKELRARLRCLRDSERVETTPAVDCRGQLPPYGDGTLDETLDRSIARAQWAWLSGMPASCAATDFRELGFGAFCPTPLNSGTGLNQFHACVFRFTKTQMPILLDLAFPSDPVCGNGIEQEGEVCDDGARNSNTTPNACREDCELPVCGDSTTDPAYDEECDDGNFVDLDGCNMSCGLEFCGDGIVNGQPAEDCEDGNTNPHDRCTDTCSDAVCGDGVVCNDPACTSGPAGGPEACDQGVNNSLTGLCHTDCSGYSRSCTLTIGVTNTVTLGALTYEARYPADGNFLGAAGTVQCTSLVTGGLVSFFENETRRTVKESLIIDAGFTAPRDIARCNYATNDTNLVPSDFTFNILAAATPDFEDTTATLAVTSIVCQ